MHGRDRLRRLRVRRIRVQRHAKPMEFLDRHPISIEDDSFLERLQKTLQAQQNPADALTKSAKTLPMLERLLQEAVWFPCLRRRFGCLWRVSWILRR